MILTGFFVYLLYYVEIHCERCDFSFEEASEEATATEEKLEEAEGEAKNGEIDAIKNVNFTAQPKRNKIIRF